MPITSIVFIGAMAILAIGQSVQSRGGAGPAPQRNAGEGVSRPYQKIFTAPEPRKPQELQAAPEILTSTFNQQPRVVCGMVVVPVTSAADPKMVVQRPTNDPNVEAKIRVIEPQICK